MHPPLISCFLKFGFAALLAGAFFGAGCNDWWEDDDHDHDPPAGHPCECVGNRSDHLRFPVEPRIPSARMNEGQRLGRRRLGFAPEPPEVASPLRQRDRRQRRRVTVKTESPQEPEGGFGAVFFPAGPDEPIEPQQGRRGRRGDG